MTVTIVELAPGFCSFDNPDVTCIATSTHEAVVAGLSEPPYTYQWSATGIAQVVSPTAQQTDVRTEAAQDIVFTLRVEVTDAVGRVAVTQVAVNHVHVGLAPDLRITQQGNRRVTQGSDRRITQ